MTDDDDGRLNYSAGSGAGSRREARYDEKAVDSTGMHSEKATRVGDSQTPIMRSKEARESMPEDWGDLTYKRLQELNEGKFSDDYKQLTREAARKRDLLQMASQFDCTKLQTQRALTQYNELDIQSYGQFTAETIALATITIAVNKDNRALRGGIASEADAERFKEVCDNYNIDPEQVTAVRKTIS